MTGESRGAVERARRHPAVLAAGLAAVALVAWLLLRGGGADDEEAPPAVVAAATATATVEDFPVVLSALGSVDARPGHEAQLAAPAQTRVSRILVATGDRVAAGQPLIALDESVWAAQSAEAEAALHTAEQAHERARRLVSEGVAPRKDEEAAAADLAQARAALQTARHTQSLGVLRSPIAGVVTAMRAHLGQAVDVNEPLVEVVDPRGLEILFHLSPSEAARVHEGDAVRLLSGPDSAAVRVGDGTVRGVSAAIDSTTGAVEVRAAVTAPTRQLRVGESVAGEITVERHARAVVVPASAVVPADEGSQVFVVDAGGIAHATPVKLGGRTGERVQVLSGLRGGERVVTGGAYGVTDSARIVRDTAPAGGEP